jgi:hypothetical protein
MPQAEANAVIAQQWLTAEEVVSRLKISKRTLEDWFHDGRITSELQPRPRRKPERVYLAADVERREQEQKNASSAPVMRQRPPAAPKPSPSLSLVVPSDVKETAREIIDALLDHSERVPLAEKLWLNWREASALSGIPMSQLRQLGQEEKIQVERFGRAVRVRRQSLEAFAG